VPFDYDWPVSSSQSLFLVFGLNHDVKAVFGCNLSPQESKKSAQAGLYARLDFAAILHNDKPPPSQNGSRSKDQARTQLMSRLEC